MFLHQQDTKCVAGADIVRLVFDSRALEKNRSVECFPFQTNRHFPISTRISRANFRRRARVHNCFFGFALGEERGREGKVCAVIIRRYRKRMRPKRIGVAPKSGLMIRASTERDDDNGGCKHTDLFSKTPALRQFGNEPHDGDGDADERQISITIGMSLPAHLHNSNYRDQHANKPKPAGEQKRESFR